MTDKNLTQLAKDFAQSADEAELRVASYDAARLVVNQMIANLKSQVALFRPEDGNRCLAIDHLEIARAFLCLAAVDADQLRREYQQELKELNRELP